jgi:hypothetical protein
MPKLPQVISVPKSKNDVGSSHLPALYVFVYEYEPLVHILKCPHCGDIKEGRFPTCNVICKRCKARFFATSLGKSYKFSKTLTLVCNTLVVTAVAIWLVGVLVNAIIQYYAGNFQDRVHLILRTFWYGLLIALIVWGISRQKPPEI